MKKLIVALLGVILLTGCAEYSKEERQELETIDGLVYSFIVAKVEGNDDLLSQILADDAQGILKPGRHAYPGAAEEMGERYSIERYDQYFKSGVLTYRVTFYRPSTNKMDLYNVAVQNTANGWEIVSNSSMSEYYMRRATTGKDGKKVEPVVVHECEGCTE